MKLSAMDPMQLKVCPSESQFYFYREFQRSSSSHLGACDQFGSGA